MTRLLLLALAALVTAAFFTSARAEECVTPMQFHIDLTNAAPSVLVALKEQPVPGMDDGFTATVYEAPPEENVSTVLLVVFYNGCLYRWGEMTREQAYHFMTGGA